MIDAAQTSLQGSCPSRAEERAILTVTCLAAFLFFNSFGSIGVALRAIQRQFGNSLAEIQWVTLMGVVTVSSLSFCFGAGGMFGIFTRANQKVAFASVEQEEYHVLAAMLSSFGTAAGTIGTTIAVALMEIDGGELLWREPEIFANAQRFAFACLTPNGLVAFLIARKSQRGVQSDVSRYDGS